MAVNIFLVVTPPNPSLNFTGSTKQIAELPSLLAVHAVQPLTPTIYEYYFKLEFYNCYFSQLLNLSLLKWLP
jgi:hypothetical protein